MPDSYNYKVRDKTANVVTGTMMADSEVLALNKLREMGYLPIEVARRSSGLNLEINLRPGRVKLKDLSVFSRQFATMVNSGLPILRALSILAEQTDNKELAKILVDVRTDVEQGSSLSSRWSSTRSASTSSTWRWFRRARWAVCSTGAAAPGRPDRGGSRAATTDQVGHDLPGRRARSWSR